MRFRVLTPPSGPRQATLLSYRGFLSSYNTPSYKNLGAVYLPVEKISKKHMIVLQKRDVRLRAPTRGRVSHLFPFTFDEQAYR